MPQIHDDDMMNGLEKLLADLGATAIVAIALAPDEEGTGQYIKVGQLGLTPNGMRTMLAYGAVHSLKQEDVSVDSMEFENRSRTP